MASIWDHKDQGSQVDYFRAMKNCAFKQGRNRQVSQKMTDWSSKNDNTLGRNEKVEGEVIILFCVYSGKQWVEYVHCTKIYLWKAYFQCHGIRK